MRKHLQLQTGISCLESGATASFLARILVLLALVCTLTGCSVIQGIQGFVDDFGSLQSGATNAGIEEPDWFDLSMVPAYDGSPSVEIAGNTCQFSDAAFLRGSFEEYSPLDRLGRCGTAFALVGREIMPNEEREGISEVHPSGWHTDHYPWIDGEQLFNRCHLIAFQLAGENANELNLITGTRYMNVQGMLPYEERVATYVRTTGNHVLYRVTPVFEGDNLVASGVLMEAESVEDLGAGVTFCAWCYNVEPGVSIDYRTGDNQADGTVSVDEPLPPAGNNGYGGGLATQESGENAYGELPEEVFAQYADADYVLNVKTHKFHQPNCQSVVDMNPKNRQAFYGTRDEVLSLGYEPCGACRP